jgi:hypothetical protein
MVLHESASELNFHAMLLALDVHAAQQVRRGGCPRCGGPLYAAHYGRKTRGLEPGALQAGRYDVRLSLCCGREGCRARATPPSVRFLGRRVYAAIAVLVLSLRQALASVTERPLAVESAPQSPAWWTRRRWSGWWRSELWSVPWFVVQRALMPTWIWPSAAPDSLLDGFAGSVHERLRRLLVMLSPLTTQSLAPEHARIAMVQ